MKTYLVPIDFSNESRIAMNFALRLAREEKAGITLLHVYNLPVTPEYSLAPSTIEDIDREVRQGLDDWKAQAQQAAPGIPVDVTSLVGNAADAILAWEVEHNPYAIVMGTHGRGRIASALLGSVAQRLLHSARCPVVVVRPERVK